MQNMCREALLWRQLHHPYVLPFLGLGGDPSNGTIHMLSPWMENGSLSKYLEKSGLVSNRLKRIWVRGQPCSMLFSNLQNSRFARLQAA